MVSQMEYGYWNIIRQFVEHGDYQLIQLSPNQNEIWLASLQNKGPKIIRILLSDIDWSNHLQRDIELTSMNIEELRKNLRLRTIEAVNIYLSSYPPVDDWEHHFEKPLIVGNKGQTTLHNIFLHKDNLFQYEQKLTELIGFQLDVEIKEIEYEALQALKHNVISHVKEKVQREQKIFQNGKPFFTYLLIFIQVLMFAILEFNGGSTDVQNLIKFGAKDNMLILEGEWWRFFTPIFLHIGIFHLIMNTLALYYLGVAVEGIYGRWRFLFVYLVAGFSGSIASFVFSANVSAGASGAIFGCFGALLFFGTVYPSLFFRTMGRNIIGIIAINLVFGFVVPGIDNAGHIGGLIGGFLASSIVHLPQQKQWLKKVLGIAITSIAFIGMLYVGYVLQPFSDDPAFAVKMAKDQIEENKIEDAYETLYKALNGDTGSIELYFYLSFVEINLGKFEDAKHHLETLTKMAPYIHEAHFNLALVYLQLEEPEKAKLSIERALQEEPSNQSYIDLLNEIENMNH